MNQAITEPSPAEPSCRTFVPRLRHLKPTGVDETQRTQVTTREAELPIAQDPMRVQLLVEAWTIWRRRPNGPSPFQKEVVGRRPSAYESTAYEAIFPVFDRTVRT